MRLKTTINDQGQIYIPKKERDKVSFDAKNVDYLTDTCAILIIPSDFPPEQALQSVDTIRKHLKHEIDLKKANKGIEEVPA